MFYEPCTPGELLLCQFLLHDPKVFEMTLREISCHESIKTQRTYRGILCALMTSWQKLLATFLLINLAVAYTLNKALFF